MNAGFIATSVIAIIALLGGCYAVRGQLKKQGNTEQIRKILYSVFYGCLFLLIVQIIFVALLLLGVT